MKYLLTLLLLTFTAQAQIIQTNDVDEFTGMERIVSSWESVNQDSFSGKVQSAVAYLDGEYYMLIQVLSNDSWQILGANEALFLVDEKRLSYKIHEMDSEVESGYILESYIIEVDADKFFNASHVKLRINGIVYELSYKAINSFKLVRDNI